MRGYRDGRKIQLQLHTAQRKPNCLGQSLYGCQFNSGMDRLTWEGVGAKEFLQSGRAQAAVLDFQKSHCPIVRFKIELRNVASS